MSSLYNFLFWKMWNEPWVPPAPPPKFWYPETSFNSYFMKLSLKHQWKSKAGSVSIMSVLWLQQWYDCIYLAAQWLGNLKLLNLPFYLSCFLIHDHRLPHSFPMLGYLYKFLIPQIYFHLSLRITDGLVNCCLKYTFFNLKSMQPSSGKYRTKSRNGSIINSVRRSCFISVIILARLMKAFSNS